MIITLAAAKDKTSVPVLDGDKKSSSWEDFHDDDQSLIEVAWRDRETSVRISNDGGESFRVELGDGDLEKQEEQFARININTNERIRVRRLPGTCIYPNMPQGVRCEVQYVLFEREAREFQSFHFLMFQFRGSNQTHRSIMSL